MRWKTRQWKIFEDVQDLDHSPLERIYLALAAENSQPDFDWLPASLIKVRFWIRPALPLSLFPSWYVDAALILRCNRGTVSAQNIRIVDPSWVPTHSYGLKYFTKDARGVIKKKFSQSNYWVKKRIGQSTSSFSHLFAASHTTRLLNGMLRWLGYQSAEQHQWATSKRAANARPRWSTCPCLCIILYAT